MFTLRTWFWPSLLPFWNITLTCWIPCYTMMNFVKLVDPVDEGKITWKKFSSEVKKLHKDRRGAPYLTDVGGFPKLGESFYANALLGDICELKEQAVIRLMLINNITSSAARPLERMLDSRASMVSPSSAT